MSGIPHLRIPMRVISDGTFETNGQNSLDDLAQCVQVLMLTEIGDRIEVPAYGVAPMLFSTVRPNLVEDAIHRWEPRASVAVSAIIGENWDDLVTNVVENVRSRR